MTSAAWSENSLPRHPNFNAEKTNLCSLLDKTPSLLYTNLTLIILFMLLGLYFSSKLDWDSYFVSIAQTACNKIVVFICSRKLPSLDVLLCFCKSTILLCMKYCCYVWAGASNSLLDMLDKVSCAVVAYLVFCLSCHHHSKISWSVFYWYYSRRFNLGWLN